MVLPTICGTVTHFWLPPTKAGVVPASHALFSPVTHLIRDSVSVISVSAKSAPAPGMNEGWGSRSGGVEGSGAGWRGT
eukprot:1161472-Pelagomonas_calceolata.AAC.2